MGLIEFLILLLIAGICGSIGQAIAAVSYTHLTLPTKRIV